MRTIARPRRALAGGVTALLLTAVTACGGAASDTAEPESDSSDSTSTSADATDSPSESAGETEESSGGLSQGELVDAMMTAMDEYGSAHLEMKMGGAAGKTTASGDVDYGGDSPSMQMTMNLGAMGGQAMEMRLVDGIMYLSMPQLGKGKFLKIDPDDKKSPYGDMSGLSDQMDPRSSIEGFEKGLKGLKYVGEESVDGEDMGHYVLTVDLKDALDASGQLPEGGLAGAPKQVDYDLWLDSDDLMRKMEMDIMGTTMTMTMSAWGDPVDVQAPPSSDVVDQPGMMG